MMHSLPYLLLLARGEVVLDVEGLTDLLGSLTWNRWNEEREQEVREQENQEEQEV